MPFTGIVGPEELKILTDALDEYCLANGISNEADRKLAAVRIMSFYTSGAHSADELRAALKANPFQPLL